MSADLFALLAQHIDAPLTLLDVGGHGGALENWKSFGNKARIFCFEARNEEAENLSQTNQNTQIEYVPLGLSDDSEELEIHVAAAAGCSSAYPPIEALYRRYPGLGLMRPVGTVRCQTTTIDDFMTQRGLEAVHGIKLDTQGFELRILKGAEKALRTCQFVLVETEFNPLYEGQPLFGDVDRFLRERGFVLWRMQNLAHYATTPLGGEPHQMMIGSDPGIQQTIDVTNGQLFWADCFYVRQDAVPFSNAKLKKFDAVAGAALVAQWNFDDLAMEMVRKAGDADLLQQVQTLLDCEFVESVPAQIPSESFHSRVQRLDNGAWETDFSVTDTHVIYGPYIRLPYGEFEIVFNLATEGLETQPLQSSVMFDIAANMVVIDAIELLGSEGTDILREGKVRLRFFNSQPKALFEFRIATFGRPFNGTLSFFGLTLNYLGTP